MNVYNVNTQKAEKQDTLEDYVAQLIRSHFTSLRTKQKQMQNLTALTKDIIFLIRFVNDSLTNPIPVLKTLGIICLKNITAFNIEAFEGSIRLSKGRALSQLHREGWKNAEEDAYKMLGTLVGQNATKQWSCLKNPSDSEFSVYLAENSRLIATPANINQTSVTPKSSSDSAENRFPLVTIHYERVIDQFEIADFIPNPYVNPTLKVCNVDSYDARAPNKV